MKTLRAFKLLCINKFQRCPSLPPPPPPRQSRGICSRFQSRGWGIRNFIAAHGAGHQHSKTCIPRCDPRLFDRRVFERQISLSGRTRSFVRDWLVHQGQKILSMFLKICFLNFRYFLITCKHINISDKVNFI